MDPQHKTQYFRVHPPLLISTSSLRKSKGQRLRMPSSPCQTPSSSSISGLISESIGAETMITKTSATKAVTITPVAESRKELMWEVEEDFSEIQPRLFLGTYKGSLDKAQMEELGISHVIQAVEVEENPHSDHFQYLNVYIEDTIQQDLSLHLDQCADYIHTVLSQNSSHRVFCHCGSGISRSAALVIAYMMKYDPRFDHSFRSAYDYTKERRMQVKPNRGFKKQLLAYEMKLKSNMQVFSAASTDKQ